MPIEAGVAILASMKRLYALFLLLALMLAPLAAAPASASGPNRESITHCQQAQSPASHGHQGAPHHPDAHCCPAAAPAAMASGVGAGEAIQPVALLTERPIAALVGLHPVIEIPPPRA